MTASAASSAAIDGQFKLDTKITSLTPLELKSGLTEVRFFGKQSRFCQPQKEGSSVTETPECSLDTSYRGFIFVSQDPEKWFTKVYFASVNWTTPYDVLPLSLDEGENSLGGYSIREESFMGITSVRSVMFLDGQIAGHKETFFVTATRIPQGEAPFVHALPVEISVYGFSAGTPPGYGSLFLIPPHFYQIQSYVTKTHYCSSYLALASELPISFTPNERKKIQNMKEREDQSPDFSSSANFITCQ